MQCKTLGTRVKELRLYHGLSQSELSKILNIGNSTLSMYESNSRIPGDDVKQKIADYFNVSIDYLLGRDGEYIGTPPSGYQIENIELLQFAYRLGECKNLRTLFKRVKSLSDSDIEKIIKFIDIIEDKTN
ncbi:helix-turn-helix transcriptional regulator [Niameybacter massiliensis]|uniref:Helix-turn-helix transcriptional regulator n=1 Tax=Holtiella tumoricola TaxID=3018743 RepID=A0AA42DQR1_9FIRM|nr:helix-turn-helix transcriptional regulator [Holtiella tumoricola]MDA3733613.1 helix-turn-helix transcriptional regulator [Holtiella tumoricola]